MTRYFCDICGKEIDINTDMIDVQFFSYKLADDTLRTMTKNDQTEFQLCVACASGIKLAIAGLKKKVRKKDGEQNG